MKTYSKTFNYINNLNEEFLFEAHLTLGALILSTYEYNHSSLRGWMYHDTIKKIINILENNLNNEFYNSFTNFIKAELYYKIGNAEKSIMFYKKSLEDKFDRFFFYQGCRLFIK